MNFRRLDFPASLVMLMIVLGVLSACTSLISNQADVIQPGALTETTDKFATLTETYTPEAGSTSLPSIPTRTETDSQPPTATATSIPEIKPTATFTPIPMTRFAVIGDFGLAGQPEADVASLVKSWEPELIITTGDNNYPDGEAETIDDNIGQYYQAFIYPYHGAYGPGAEVNRFFPTLGNHD